MTVDMLVYAEFAPPNPAYLQAIEEVVWSELSELIDGVHLTLWAGVRVDGDDCCDDLAETLKEAVKPLGGRLVSLCCANIEYVDWVEYGHENEFGHEDEDDEDVEEKIMRQGEEYDDLIPYKPTEEEIKDLDELLDSLSQEDS